MTEVCYVYFISFQQKRRKKCIGSGILMFLTVIMKNVLMLSEKHRNAISLKTGGLQGKLTEENKLATSYKL